MDDLLNSTESQITSPVLLALESARRPNPPTACQACPGAVWFLSKTSLNCFCRVMHVQTWSSDAPTPLMGCDGQVLAKQEQEARD